MIYSGKIPLMESKTGIHKDPLQLLTDAIKLGAFNNEEHEAFMVSSLEQIDLNLSHELAEQAANQKLVGLYREAMMKLKPEDITPVGIINEILRGYHQYQDSKK